MLFGDVNNFATECYHEHTTNEARWVFGRICIWAGGHRLGDINEPACVLNVSKGSLQRFLDRLNSLDDLFFRDLNDRDAFKFLNHVLYLDDERSNEQVANDAKRFSKFDFLTNGGESFDRTTSFAVVYGDQLRLLFEDDEKGFASAHVALSTFTQVVQDFLIWVVEETENASER